MVNVRTPLPPVCFAALVWFGRQLPGLSLTVSVSPTAVIAYKHTVK